MRFRVSIGAGMASKDSDHVITAVGEWLAHYVEHAPTVEIKPHYVHASACIDVPGNELVGVIGAIVSRFQNVFCADPPSFISVNWKTD